MYYKQTKHPARGEGRARDTGRERDAAHGQRREHLTNAAVPVGIVVCVKHTRHALSK